ncbi:hypothetical protein K502DRAFT_321168 [Neoconidiobolus thromboides FSU 785]|nr:hypothetical protein K502DRAFT_321168 [Neoconidiobolus thromboides FSU 785]
MAFSWRSANITYLKYSQICAQAVRNSLKKELREVVAIRNEQGIKFAKWQNGKSGEYQFIQPQKNEE